ncbi:hypothetical protein BGZ96_012558 [Linnemannia gamsii]|uniref:Uncharacterized protein n=1 Tax=Linnemannia gamsii TaxID=64522 RepID=A0ABQ7JQV3_9FUNG|nr:hypothetical protein BGZ96_012558 [Linnemannia gamsii]
MANSIYSVLSEDWNRPYFFARSKSVRCPTSLQSNLRALPPYDQLTASIASTNIGKIKTAPLMTAAAGIARSRCLRNRDGSVYQLTPGHELHSVDIRITWRPVTENFVEDSGDPALAISRTCLSALPKGRDRFGFVEYDDEGDEDEEGTQDQRHNAVSNTANIPAAQSRLEGHDDWILVDAGRPILDVNDTSAMIAAGIDPSEPHPNPEAFYLLNHPTDNQSIHRGSLEIGTEEDTKAYDCRLNHEPDCPAASGNSIDDPEFKQNLRFSQNKTAALFRSGSVNL